MGQAPFFIKKIFPKTSPPIVYVDELPTPYQNPLYKLRGWGSPLPSINKNNYKQTKN